MSPLVTTEWLERHLGADDLAVLDASLHLPGAHRDAAAEFADGHIPSARFLDLASLTDPHSKVPSAIPSRGQFEAHMRSLGISARSRIVLYDASDLRSSARAWFIARLYGADNLAVLDGGLGKWKAEGRALQAGMPHSDEGDFTTCVGTGTVRSKADMLLNINTEAEQVVDARDTGRFTGETVDTVHNLPGGHIPGARHLFFRDLLAEDGTFRPVSEIAQAFARAGIDPSKPLAASCGSGVTASVLLFAQFLLGHQHGALYDGSWSEWGADPATPKETGSV